ncbi:hypothetical protein CFC21_053317 [Triticum aestivum]|uniref:Thioredoxin domain-containing protein n=2 Tax=Triticum aestivum TaxID=4565 RepID=A0A9R1GAQ9_WHEAT|nr:prostamide/prostaglandin F synthase-like [Triticum aestivum]KAF7044037.1 hypothetical protein CFC21_053317 [Triticum aestivum]
MATAVSLCLPRVLHTSAPRPSFHRRVSVQGAGATLPDARRLCRRSSAVSAAAGASPPEAGTAAWDSLGGVSVFAAGTGDAVPLRDLWDPSEGVVVVALLRHFGCFCCWELASDMKKSMPKFESAGAKLIAIGVGTSDKARILADGLPFPVDSLYADPERKAYDVLGLYHGLGRTLFSPASSKIYSRLDSIKEATKNYKLKGTPADLTGIMQQGGMFVFRGKELLYAWRDEGTGDHAPLDDFLGICRQVPAA